MDPKSKEIYEKIENFLEERKGRERRTEPREEEVQETGQERRKRQDRRSSASN